MSSALPEDLSSRPTGSSEPAFLASPAPSCVDAAPPALPFLFLFFPLAFGAPKASDLRSSASLACLDLAPLALLAFLRASCLALALSSFSFFLSLGALASAGSSSGSRENRLLLGMMATGTGKEETTKRTRTDNTVHTQLQAGVGKNATFTTRKQKRKTQI